MTIKCLENYKSQNLITEFNSAGHYLTISINRPNSLNTLTTNVLIEIAKLLQCAEKEQKIRCVVLRGTKNYSKKPAFSVGADLKSEYFLNQNISLDEREHYMLEKIRAYDRIEEFNKPLIAAIDGFAFGGGLELALTCDLVVASKRSLLGFPEIKHGLFPTNGGTQRMIKHIGLNRTKKMIYFGDFYAPDILEKWGFITEVCENTNIEEIVHDYASKLGNSPTIALKYAKKSINFGTQIPSYIGLHFESMGFGINTSSNDFEEGVTAFQNRRHALFEGK